MVNQNVYHKIFGTGIVTKINDSTNIITAVFGDKPHDFVYPDAFEKFLTAEDADTQKTILAEIERKKILIKQQKSQIPERSVIKTQYRAITTKSPVKNKFPIYKNIIFKYNYCDGGASTEQIGFNGVCAKDTIRYNIETAKRSWCSHDRCPCAQYLKGEYSYKKLMEEYSERGICYEADLLIDWTAQMGWDNTGAGKPRKLSSWVRQNSLCVLTTREPNDTGECDRIVFAVYLVDEFFEGNENQEGNVKAHPKFRIKLAPDEARKIRLWDYHANDNNPTQPKWGSGLSRKMDNENAAALLADIVKIKRGTKDEGLAKELFEYFCNANNIDVANPPEANGALRMAFQ